MNYIGLNENKSDESNRTISLRESLRNAFLAYKNRQKKQAIVKEK